MGIFYNITQRAIELFYNEKLSPEEAWEEAWNELNVELSMIKKSCPKRVYLGFCYNNRLQELNFNIRTGNNKNYNYANEGYRLYINDNSIRDMKIADLWRTIMRNLNEDENKAPNNQLDVLSA
ncbi:MAG TPA: hypothetical protein VHP32_03285 [Ignavibacteria bacterium]|nr:hypothetical protein [Ignavibacteria bacterium]